MCIRPLLRPLVPRSVSELRDRSCVRWAVDMASAVIGVVLAQMTILIGGHEFMSEGGARAGLGIGIGVESALRS